MIVFLLWYFLSPLQVPPIPPPPSQVESECQELGNGWYECRPPVDLVKYGKERTP